MQAFRENEFREKALLADDAHIWAYSAAGPRGSEPGAPADRNAPENIILLCKLCHAEIDQQPKKFSPSVLTDLRETHYEWVSSRLGNVYAQKSKFHYLLYLNMPRVDMYAVNNSIPLPHVDTGIANSFRDLGFSAGRLMAAYTEILNSYNILARQITAQSDISSLEVGSYCFVESMDFRTVKIGEYTDLPKAWNSDTSIIYRRHADWTLNCQIDPRWITTSTAYSTLRSGHARLCGAIRVNQVDTTTRKVIASPLFLAQLGVLLDAF